MKDLIDSMNKVVSDWKDKFDITSSVQMEFHLNEDDCLCLNEHVINMPVALKLLSAEFDASRVEFYFAGTQKVLFIGIKWPEDSVPEIDTVNFGYEGV